MTLKVWSWRFRAARCSAYTASALGLAIRGLCHNRQQHFTALLHVACFRGLRERTERRTTEWLTMLPPAGAAASTAGAVRGAAGSVTSGSAFFSTYAESMSPSSPRFSAFACGRWQSFNAYI